MTHTNNRMQRHWIETRAFISANWPKITDLELDRIDGDFDKFLFYLKEYYGGFPFNEAKARAKMQAFLNGMDARHPERITVAS